MKSTLLALALLMGSGQLWGQDKPPREVKIYWQKPDGTIDHGDLCMREEVAFRVLLHLARKYPDDWHWVSTCNAKPDLFEVVTPAIEDPAPKGQTGTVTVEPPKCVTVPSADGCNTCTSCGGQITSCTLAYCMKTPLPEIPGFDGAGHTPEPIDVPAVQETRTPSKPCTYIAGLDPGDCGSQPYKVWTCKDTSRGLWESVDGKQHWCRRAQP